MRVAVFGAGGRMGAEVCQAVTEAPDLDLVAGVDLDEDRTTVEHQAEVVVDFTTPNAVLDNIRWCVERGIHVVAGTSGFTQERLDLVRELVAANPGVGVLVAPNFSVGAVLMMHFAEQAASYFESVEVVELHHPDKVDAPSGTAQATAQRVANARDAAGLGPVPDATTTSLAGARGAEIAGIPVHSVRLRGLVAHQEVMFGSNGETLTIRHDSLNRAGFMPGVLAAIRAVGELPGLTIGIEGLLGI